MENGEEHLFGDHADIDMARGTVDPKSKQIVFHKVGPRHPWNAKEALEEMEEALDHREGVWADMDETAFNEEKIFHALLKPLGQYRQQSCKAEKLEQCMYYSCSMCGKVSPA